jgi:S-adenosylmethionine:tRNA ribosyltransferase-isomerase
LHVNGGTFLPIKAENVFEHSMHSEFGTISKKSAEIINEYKKKGGRVIAVGTTVLRLLESSKDKNGLIKEFNGETDIYLKPGSKINSVDGLITNFHTPKSTLLLLVYAFIGEQKTKKLYEYAIKKKLRFFSYGDACLLWKM